MKHRLGCNSVHNEDSIFFPFSEFGVLFFLPPLGRPKSILIDRQRDKKLKNEISQWHRLVYVCIRDYK